MRTTQELIDRAMQLAGASLGAIYRDPSKAPAGTHEAALIGGYEMVLRETVAERDMLASEVVRLKAVLAGGHV